MRQISIALAGATLALALLATTPAVTKDRYDLMLNEATFVCEDKSALISSLELSANGPLVEAPGCVFWARPGGHFRLLDRQETFCKVSRNPSERRAGDGSMAWVNCANLDPLFPREVGVRDGALTPDIPLRQGKLKSGTRGCTDPRGGPNCWSLGGYAYELWARRNGLCQVYAGPDRISKDSEEVVAWVKCSQLR